MARNLKTVGQVAEAGIFTEGQLRYWLHLRASNGLAAHGVPVNIGRRVYIDVDAFDRWLDSQQGARSSAPGVCRNAGAVNAEDAAGLVAAIAAQEERLAALISEVQMLAQSILAVDRSRTTGVPPMQSMDDPREG